MLFAVAMVAISLNGCGGVIRKTSAFKEAKVKDVKVKKGSQVKTEVDTSTAMGFCLPPKDGCKHLCETMVCSASGLLEVIV